MLTVPHHPNTQAAELLDDGTPAWNAVDWSVINHDYQRVVEICQARGSHEVPGGPIPEMLVTEKDAGASVQTALAMGHRLAFIGSTDAHTGRPGDDMGRVIVICPELTREAIWDALYDRRCYATSGPRILLDFRLNGELMGREVTLDDAGTPRRIQWRVIGEGPLRKIDLLANNIVIDSIEGKGRDELTGDITIQSPLKETEWYYLRVFQEDGEMAWSSPIWVNKTN